MPTGRPRVAWVTALPPHFSGGGGHIRQAHFLRDLADHADTTLIVAGQVTDPAVRELTTRIVEVPVALSLPSNPVIRRLASLRRLLVDREPAEVVQHRKVRSALAPFIDHLGPFDSVCAQFTGMGPLAPPRENRHGRWVLDMHNLTSVMAAHERAVWEGRRQRWHFEREAVNAARWERHQVDRWDRVIVTSRDDAEAIGDGRVVVVRNGVDVDRIRPSALPTEPRLVFVGALYTRPNIDGICWFVHEVLPLIRANVPDASLDIVGARPLSVVEGLVREGVVLHPNVPDVVPHLLSARVAVVPLRIGSGSRLKALEAMAAGRPVVGTTIGLGGTDFEPGRHALVADDPASFAAAVVRMLSDTEEASRLCAAGRSLVESCYRWEDQARRNSAVLLEGDGRTLGVAQ